MSRLQNGDPAILQSRFPRELSVWSDSNRQYNYYAAHILRDVEEDEDNQNTIYAETEASQVEAAAATAAAPADNVVVHDDHEQLLSGDDEDIIQVVGSAVINITDEGEQADERDPRIPSRDLNATVKNVPYGLALGTLEFGTMNVMNCEYESHNYRQPSSMLRKQYNARVLTTNTYTGIEIMRVLMSAVIGAVTGLTGLMISVSIENFAKPKYAVFAHFLNKLKYDPDGHSLALPLFVACVVTVGVNVSLVLCAALLGCYSPVSTGSGIPHIKAYLNGVKIPKVLHINTFFCKVAGVIFSVVGGMPVGKEGPMIHSGAIIGGGLPQGKMSSVKLELDFFKYFRNDEDKRLFVACGSAAGVSAAFGAPIGGMLFNIEEGASDLNLPSITQYMISSLISLSVLNFGRRLLSGGTVVEGGLFAFGTFEDGHWDVMCLGVFALMGVFGGLTGAFFNWLNMHLTKHRMKWVHSFWRHIRQVGVCACIVTLVAIWCMFLVGDCRKYGAQSRHTGITLFCGDGHYPASASIWFNTPENVLQDLYHSPTDDFHYYNLTVFVIAYFFISCLTYGLRISSGIFIPTLLTGACWGRMVGILVISCGSSFNDWGSVGKFALIGSVAQLAGIVRISFSVTCIVAEATGCLEMVLPVMIASFIAKEVGEFFNHGIYDIHNEMSGVPILPWKAPVGSTDQSVTVIMAKRVMCLTKRVRLREVWDTLHYSCHNAFPVVSYDTSINHNQPAYQQRMGRFLGIVLRDDLITMLSNAWFEDSMMHADELCWEMLQENYPRFGSTSQLFFRDSVKDNSFLNLDKIMDSGHIIPAGSTYKDAFERFRRDWVRHLVVVDEHHEVAGIITRKDLYRYVNHSNKTTEGPKLTTTPVLKQPGARRWTVVVQNPLYLPAEQKAILDKLVNGDAEEEESE